MIKIITKSIKDFNINELNKSDVLSESTIQNLRHIFQSEMSGRSLSDESLFIKRIIYNSCKDLEIVLRNAKSNAISMKFQLLYYYFSNTRTGYYNGNKLNKVPEGSIGLMHIAAFYDSLECLMYLHRKADVKIDVLSAVFSKIIKKSI